MYADDTIETTEPMRLRYIAHYAAPWDGCGTEIDVPAGTRFTLAWHDEYERWYAGCDDEAVRALAKETERVRVLKKRDPESIWRRFMGIRYFLIPDEAIEKGMVKVVQ